MRRAACRGSVRAPTAPKMNRPLPFTNRVRVVKRGFCLRCIECHALSSEHRFATERYTVLIGMPGAHIPEAVPVLEFRKLKDEVAEARLDCHRTRQALITHRKLRSAKGSSHPNINTALLLRSGNLRLEDRSAFRMNPQSRGAGPPGHKPQPELAPLSGRAGVGAPAAVRRAGAAAAAGRSRSGSLRTKCA